MLRTLPFGEEYALAVVTDADFYILSIRVITGVKSNDVALLFKQCSAFLDDSLLDRIALNCFHIVFALLSIFEELEHVNL